MEQEAPKENGVSDSEDAKTPDTENSADQPKEAASEKSGDEKIEKVAEKKKEKAKKKWSFRGISFSKKDKSKPNKEGDKADGVKEVTEEVSFNLIAFSFLLHCYNHLGKYLHVSYFLSKPMALFFSLDFNEEPVKSSGRFQKRCKQKLPL